MKKLAILILVLSSFSYAPQPVRALPAEVAPVLVQPTILETPATSDPVLSPEPRINKPTEGVVQSEPPLVQISDDKPEPFVVANGFDNMCYQMEDGSWTTVIYKGDGGPGMYPYAGELDPATGAPATAEGSQAWCLANAPAPVDNN